VRKQAATISPDMAALITALQRQPQWSASAIVQALLAALAVVLAWMALHQASTLTKLTTLLWSMCRLHQFDRSTFDLRAGNPRCWRSYLARDLFAGALSDRHRPHASRSEAATSRGRRCGDGRASRGAILRS